MTPLELINPLMPTVNKVRILYVSVDRLWYRLEHCFSVFHFISKLSIAVSKTLLLNYYQV